MIKIAGNGLMRSYKGVFLTTFSTFSLFNRTLLDQIQCLYNLSMQFQVKLNKDAHSLCSFMESSWKMHRNLYLNFEQDYFLCR